MADDTGLLHGSEGLVTLSAPYNVGIHVFEWTGRIQQDEYPADVFVDTETPAVGALGHTFYYGKHQFNGSIQAYLDDTEELVIAAIAPGRAAVNMWLVSHQGAAANGDNDQELSFAGHLNNIQIVVNTRTGLNMITADVKSDGAVTPQNYS